MKFEINISMGNRMKSQISLAQFLNCKNILYDTTRIYVCILYTCLIIIYNNCIYIINMTICLCDFHLSFYVGIALTSVDHIIDMRKCSEYNIPNHKMHIKRNWPQSRYHSKHIITTQREQRTIYPDINMQYYNICVYILDMNICIIKW